MIIAIVTTWILFNLALAGLLTWAHRARLNYPANVVAFARRR